MPKDRLSLTRRMLDAALAQAGYSRITAAAATTARTFETSDSMDVPLGGKRWDRTLKQIDVQRLSKILWEAYKQNPIIWGMVEMVVRATVGKETRLLHNALEDENGQIKAQAAVVQKQLDKWWFEPANDWPSLAGQVQRDLILFGELVPLYLVNSLTGDVEMGFIPQNSIKKLVTAENNARRIVGVTVTLEGGTERVFQCVHTYGGAEQPLELYGRVGGDKLLNRWIGEVSYWCLNKALSSARGHGDFCQVVDPANDALQIVHSTADRAKIQNRVVSEVIFPEGGGWDQVKINAAMNPADKDNYINPPRLDDTEDGPRVFAHSAGIKYEIKQPAIGASESETVFKLALALVSAGSNIPLHWLGWADELTYASAKDISANTGLAYFQDRQKHFRDCVKQASDFSLDQKRIFTSALDGIPDEVLYDYDVVLPEVNVKNVKELADIMAVRINAVLAAMMQTGADGAPVLKPEEMQHLIRQAVSDSGMSLKI